MAEPNAAPAKEGNQPRRGLLKSPVLRKLVKLGLDALAACVAFQAASNLLLQGFDFGVGLLAFELLAMFINIGFRFHTQHYRALGIHDARSLLWGTTTLAVTAMTLCYVRGGWSASPRWCWSPP
jgi:hypothetical protein